MREVLGVGIRWQLDPSALVNNRAVPKFITPQRLDSFSESPSVSMSPSVAHAARARRGQVMQDIGDHWRRCRDRCPELWNYATWALAEQDRQPDTRELSGEDFAARMRTRRDLHEQQETTAPDCGPDEGGRS